MAKTILVVDDMAIFREPIQAVLRADGFEVWTASNGVEALAQLARHRPDLVLLDLGMPVMDGLSALKRLREDVSLGATPVIMLSAEGDRSRIVEAIKLGISGYLLKAQFSVRLLRERVHAVLAISSAELPAAAGGSSEVEGRRAGTIAESVATEVSSAPRNVATRNAHTGASRAAARSTGPRVIQPDADLNSLLPIMSRTEVMERVTAEGELTGFSPTVSQVLKLTASENCSMDQVAKAVGQDQAISLKILKLSNSSAYSHGDRVDTVHKAVLRIGMHNIRQAVLNIGVVERFGSLAFERHLSTPLFWEHSIACGLIAAQLARALKHKDPDIAFTAGLLHDLGRVIYAEKLGERYVEVLDTARAMQVPVELVEARLLLLTHAEVMARVLHAWRFPKQLINPIVFHHVAPGDAKGLAGPQSVDALRLGLANRLAHALMLGCSGNDTIYPTEEHCRSLGADGTMVRQIEESARQQTDETKVALLTHSNSAAWPRRVEQCRAALTVPFRPLYVSLAPELDAYRIFCGELVGTVQDGSPNLTVVHIAAAKERSQVAERVVTAERDAGVHGLPLLILSPGGRLKLGDDALGTRSYRLVGTPTLIPTFIDTVNDLIGRSDVKKAA